MERKLTDKEINRYKKNYIGKLAIAAKRAKENGDKPFIFHFLTTLRCNCDCESCLWKDNTAKGELSKEEIKRIYLEAKDAGFIMTVLWGGEPTLRKDLTEIIKFIREKAEFAFIGMVTNGYLIPKQIHEYGNDLNLILISLDSPIREEHDKIRALKGLYDNVMKSVKMIKSDFPLISLQFSFSISKYNIHRVEEMIALGDQIEVPIAFNVINTIRHYSSGDIDEKGSLSATDEEISAAFTRILDAKRNGSKILNSESYLTHFIGGKKQYNCHARRVFMYVNYNGDIENCLELDRPIANLRDISVIDALELPRMKKFLEDAEKCSSCNSPTMIDTSYIWEDLSLLTKSGGISLG
jgi:MoaA/NifB/PqqE/SkfB family radical SAM enzyme